MGLSMSFFERFSSALQWYMELHHGAHVSHLIDDFLFVGPPDQNRCSLHLSKFMHLCNELGVWDLMASQCF